MITIFHNGFNRNIVVIYEGIGFKLSKSYNYQKLVYSCSQGFGSASDILNQMVQDFSESFPGLKDEIIDSFNKVITTVTGGS